MITIPEPCSEDWNRMQAVDHVHRHCDSCAKNVIDFTSMSDDEVVIFLQNRNDKMCGRFRADQLQRPYRKIPEPKYTSNWWKAAMLLPLSLFGKQATAQQDTTTVRDSVQVAPETEQLVQDTTLNGQDSTAIVSDTNRVENDSIVVVASPEAIQPATHEVIFTVVVSSGAMILGGFGPPPPEEIISCYVAEGMCTQPNAVPTTWWTTPFPWLTRYLRKPQPVILQPDPTIPLNEKDPVAAANTVPPSTNTVDQPWYSMLLPVPFRRRKK